MSEANESGRFAYEGLARIIHEKARLSILSSLSAHSGGLAFNDLKELCRLTDGNLSRQLQILKDEGFVEITKSSRGKRPLTIARLTASGRKRFVEYLDVLQGVIADAGAVAQARAQGRASGSLGRPDLSAT